MSWKKNAISYLFWFVYALATGCVTAALSAMLCKSVGVAAFWGGILAILYIGIAAGIVYLLRHFEPKWNHKLTAAAEKASVVLLLAAGLALRISNMEDAGQLFDYFKAAEVAMGQKIPNLAHGAVYFYVWILRGAFSLLGNNFSAGIWLQIALHSIASLILYFALRKVSGRLAALITFGFCMCAPYMVRSTLLLSPEMLYYCLFAIAVGMVAMCHERKLKIWDQAFFLMGIFAAFCCYVDIAGCLILLLALASVFCKREEMPGIRKQMMAVFLCLSGAVSGFMLCIFLDASLSGTTVQRVLQTWGGLYLPERFRMPFAMADLSGFMSGALTGSASAPESLLLCGFMVFGIFSFWCDRQKERMTFYIAAVCGIIMASCFGMFTDEMPGFFYLYLLLAVLAGISIGQCFPSADPVPEEGRDSVDVAGCKKEAEEFTGARENEIEGNGVGVRKNEEAVEMSLDYQEETEPEKIKYLENPLPLPKKHVKRVMDYPLKEAADYPDFDYAVDEDDDFDI